MENGSSTGLMMIKEHPTPTDWLFCRQTTSSTLVIHKSTEHMSSPHIVNEDERPNKPPKDYIYINVEIVCIVYVNL
jgi:hypothetical protein